MNDAFQYGVKQLMKQCAPSSIVGKAHLFTPYVGCTRTQHEIVQYPAFRDQPPILVVSTAKLDNMADPNPDQPTRLTGKKGDHTFEMWVEVEGTPLEVYGISEGDDGILEAWIASEIDKVS
jgi:hypothetical protein